MLIRERQERGNARNRIVSRRNRRPISPRRGPACVSASLQRRTCLVASLRSSHRGKTTMEEPEAARASRVPRAMHSVGKSPSWSFYRSSRLMQATDDVICSSNSDSIAIITSLDSDRSSRRHTARSSEATDASSYQPRILRTLVLPKWRHLSRVRSMFSDIARQVSKFIALSLGERPTITNAPTLRNGREERKGEDVRAGAAR